MLGGLDGMLDKNFNRLKRPCNVHIQHSFSLSSIHSPIFIMSGYNGAVLMVLTELADSDDEKPRRENIREWIKRKRESHYFQNIFQELKVKDRVGFKDMLRMSVTDSEFLLSQISDLISQIERISGNRPFLADERLKLTL